MILPEISQQLWVALDDVMIPVDKIAHVQTQHSLLHALLVLSSVRYATIPVLDKQGVFHGLVSPAMIMSNVMGIDAIEVTQLEQKTVADVMQTDAPTITQDTDQEDVLRLLIDHNFVSVVNHEQHFIGMVTRREVLKKINHLLHHKHLQLQKT